MSFVPAFEIGIWNAWIFMIWLLIQTVAARLVGKEVYQRGGQPPDMKPSHTYKIVGYISMPLWLLATLYSIFLPFQLGTIWFSVGLTIFLVGLLMLTVASVNFAATPMNEPVTRGMYRYSRHPIYMSIFLIYISAGIASVSWIFLLVSIVWLLLIRLAVDDEERYCLEKYGPSYREYMTRTPRWIGIPTSGA
ncbi:methyltransferase family protein [Chloroflexota bacterium]